MEARSLQELYQDHQTTYPTFKQNSDLKRQLFDSYLESESYILSTSHLLKDYGGFADFMGIYPFNPNSLSSIENNMFQEFEKICQGEYDEFYENNSELFNELGKIKKFIEEFSDNLTLMQLFIDSKKNNPELYQKIAQFTFATHLSQIKPPNSNSSSENAADIIEKIVAEFEKNKIALQQKIEELREQCQKLGECLLSRKINRDATEQFRKAVYRELAQEEKLQLSVAPNATQFGSSIRREEITITPTEPSPSLHQ